MKPASIETNGIVETLIRTFGNRPRIAPPHPPVDRVPPEWKVTPLDARRIEVIHNHPCGDSYRPMRRIFIRAEQRLFDLGHTLTSGSADQLALVLESLGLDEPLCQSVLKVLHAHEHDQQ